jgi:predicted nuclease of restriction endonuclease-like RecB superfamily
MIANRIKKVKQCTLPDEKLQRDKQKTNFEHETNWTSLFLKFKTSELYWCLLPKIVMATGNITSTFLSNMCAELPHKNKAKLSQWRK